MAIVKVNKNFTPKVKEIKYLAKSFPDFRQNLIDFTKVYFPNTYSDFSETSAGGMFIELASYVGDVLSFYIDNQFRENLIFYAQEPENILNIAQSIGFKPKPATPATTTLDIYQLVPAQNSGSNFQPDPNYFLRLDSNMVVNSDVNSGNVAFRTTDAVDFSNPTNRSITVYSTNTNNQPLTYLAKKQVDAIAGTIKTFTYTFGSAQKFSVITLPDANVLEVLSVVDSNGNLWNEVDYLAQDVIASDTFNSSPISASQSIPPSYLLQFQTQPRRFVTRYNSNFQLELRFGSGVTNDSSETVSLDTVKIGSSEYQTRLGNSSLDPGDFLSSTSYGLAPSNTSLTITYVVGGGIQTNVPSNTITNVVSMNVLNNTVSLSAQQLALFQTTQASVAVNNSQAAVGGKGTDSVEEIRQNALGFFNAQNRVVSRQDYIARCHAMPPKYGGIAKVYVIQDDQINSIMQATSTGIPQNAVLASDQVFPGAINLYVLGYDVNNNLTTLNNQTKQNLQTYLSQYKMLTDAINILDAFIITIGVNFRIVAFSNYNVNDVLARSLDAVKSFFDITKWDINQPIIINDLYLQIGNVDGVQSVTSVEIVNKYAFRDGPQYSPFIYDITAATDTGVIYPSADPSIFTVLSPDFDIVGSANS